MSGIVSAISRKGRDKNLRKNIIWSFGLKGISFIFSFLLISITIRYLNTEQYGVWITLLSILSWVSFADIGLGNGLRNKLTEALSENRIRDAKEYIATTYAAMSVIVLVLYIAALITIPMINWQNVFNSKTMPNSQLIKLVIIVFTFFLFNFVLSLYNQLYYSVQKAAVTGIGQFLFNLLSVVGILLLKEFTSANIVYVSLSYSVSMILPSVFLTCIFFYAYKSLRPKIKYIKVSKIKSILSLGVKFFIIQIAAVIYFSTNNFIIIQVCGPKDVSVYDTVYKLFNGINTLFILLMTPFWSAFTEAYVKKDFNWIRGTIKKLNLLLIPITVLLILVSVFYKPIFNMWIGNRLIIPKGLIIANAIYCLIYIWSNIYTYLLNGINVLKLQMFISVFICIVNIPMCIYFAKYLGMGIIGIQIAQIITAIPSAILMPMEVCKIFRKAKV